MFIIKSPENANKATPRFAGRPTLYVKNSVDILAGRACDDRLRSNEETVEHQAYNTTERTSPMQIKGSAFSTKYQVAALWPQE